MSISKAQAAALADGFVESQGSEKDGLNLKETFTQLFLIAGELVQDAQKNLNDLNKISTGALSSSLLLDEPVQNGNIVRVDVKMNYYGQFVNKGVKGTKGGSSKAGYKFRSDFPSDSMVKAFGDWIKTGKKLNTSVSKYKAYGTHEAKQRSVGQLSAYAVARAVKMKGLKPTGFLDRAAVAAVVKTRDRLGAALKIDIINSLKQI